MPRIVDAVKIPVLASGGIGDARGLAAALMIAACACPATQADQPASSLTDLLQQPPVISNLTYTSPGSDWEGEGWLSDGQ